MGAKRIFVKVVGVTQGTLGAGALILIFLLHFDSFAARSMLNVPVELLPLNALILGVFGLFSLMSGLLLFYKN
jgi:multisubunit Na+/H+ antiporter MnhB subunit